MKPKFWIAGFMVLTGVVLATQGCSTTGGSKTPTSGATATATAGAIWTPFATDTETNTISPTSTRTVTRTRTDTRTFTPSYTFTPVFTPVAYLATVGGYDQYYNLLSTIYVAPIPSWGGIGNWTSTGSMPGGRLDTSSVATGGYLFVAGGYDQSYNYSCTVYSAPVTGASVGSFSSQPSLPGGRVAPMMTTDGSYLYLVGGYNGSSYVSTVYSASISGGTVSSWSSQTSLPVTVAYSRIVYDQGYLYLLGGDFYSSYSSTVYAATASGGTVGSWTSIANIGQQVTAHVAFTDGASIFTVGGALSPTMARAATISSPGSLSTWSSTAGVSNGCMYGGGEQYAGYGYVYGGYDQSYYNTSATYFAPISGATLGTWVSGSPISAMPLENASAVWQ